MMSPVCANSTCSSWLPTTTHGTRLDDQPEPTFDHTIYCSVDCSISDQPDLRHVRSLKRVSAFLDELFLVVGRTTTSRTLTGTRMTNQGVLELIVRRKQSAGESSFDPILTTSGERDTMLSHNSCRILLRYYSGIIAFLFEVLELPLRTREINLYEVQAVQDVVIIHPDSREPSKVASVHTMLEVASSHPLLPIKYPHLSRLLGTRGLYMDITGRQYGFAPGLVPVSTYPARKIPSRKFDPEAIGATYRDHLHQIRHGIRDNRHALFDYFKAEATIRTVNNTFHHHFLVNGGHAIFSDFDDKAHERTISGIVEQVGQEVERLMEIWWGVKLKRLPQDEARSVYKQTVRSCAGEGHTKVVEALERTSGLQFADLMEIR